MYQANPTYIGVPDSITFSGPMSGKVDAESVIQSHKARKLRLNLRKFALSPFRRISSKILKLKHKSEGFLQWKTEPHQVKALFYPMQLLLQIVGRFPYSSAASSGQLCRKLKGELPSGAGYPEAYDYSLMTLHWFFFLLTSVLLFITFFLISMAFTVTILGWKYPDYFHYPSLTEKESDIFKQNLVPFVLFWSCLLHSNVGDFTFIRNRRRVVDYLNEWEKIVRILKLELPLSLRTFLIVSNLWFIAFLVSMLTIQYFQIVPVAVGGAKVITLLLIKPFVNIEPPSGWSLSIGAVTLAYSMYASRALLFIYAYKCRLLRFAFKTWNGRLKEQLNPVHYESDVSEEVQCEMLYSHHVILTSMIRRTDKVFGGILQFYYAIQILNMCFELYYLARSGSFNHSVENQVQLDVFLAMALLLQNVSVFFTVSLEAAYVHDEAQKGYEILRLRGQQRYDTCAKRLLIRNLLQSYSNRIVMTGGKFFVIDRPFIIKVLGAVCTYFVIILQFGDNILPDIRGNGTESVEADLATTTTHAFIRRRRDNVLSN